MFAVANEYTTHPIDAVVRDVLAKHDVSQNPYLRRLTDGSMSREAFSASQHQFCHAVDHFSRPMAMLASRLPTAALRVSILHNVWEEHGEGDLAFHHGATFRRFLTTLDGRPALPTVPGPAVGMFNATLSGVCATDHPFAGIGLLGIIERMFADISAVIGTEVVDRGWVERDQLVHYTTHETLDLEHADEFFEIARCARDDQSIGAFERGVVLGAFAFEQFYRGL